MNESLHCLQRDILSLSSKEPLMPGSRLDFPKKDLYLHLVAKGGSALVYHLLEGKASA